MCAVCNDDQVRLHLLAVKKSNNTFFAVYRCGLDAELNVHLSFARARGGLREVPQAAVEVNTVEGPRGGAHGLGDVGELFVHEALERRGFISVCGNVGHTLGFLAVRGQRALGDVKVFHVTDVRNLPRRRSPIDPRPWSRWAGR